MKMIITLSLIAIVHYGYSQNTIITGILKNRNSSNSAVTIEYEQAYLNMRKEVLKFDLSGNFKNQIDIPYPTILIIKNDSVRLEAYITPGDSVFIKGNLISKTNFKKTLRFGGDLFKVNQLLFDIYTSSKLSTMTYGTEGKINNYYDLKRTLLRSGLNNKRLDKKDLDILEIDSISDEFKKATAMLYLLSSNQLKNDEAKGFVKTNIKPAIFKQPNFGHLTIPAVKIFWNHSYLNYLIDRDADFEKDLYVKKGYYISALTKIDTFYSQPLQDFAKASILHHLLSYPPDFRLGKDSLVNLTKSFTKTAVLNADTKNELNKLAEDVSNNYNEIKKGEAAPEIPAADLLGNPITLKTFDDKLIFIDVWASWCKPCLEQIPNVNKLIEKFTGKDIVFLMISLDNNVNDWKLSVKKNDFKSLQYHAKGFKSDFAVNYGIKGIPRYIIIKDSKILNASALSPGNPELVKELESYLH